MKILISTILMTISTATYSQYLSKFPTNSNTLLWKIEGDKVKGDCYVFGTMHVMKNEFFPQKLKNIITASELIITEIGESDYIEEFFLLPEGKNVFDKFTPDELKALVKWGKDTEGLPNNLTEWQRDYGRNKLFSLAQTVFSSTIIYDDSGEKFFLDNEIGSLAMDHGIAIDNLEQIEEQLDYMDKIDERRLVEMIIEWITKPQEQKKRFNELTEIYLKQNVEEIYQFVHENEELLPEVSEMLLQVRNKMWMYKIEQEIARQNTFIAVGAAHLGGELGLLRLLQKKGYKLSPVFFND